MRLSDLNLLTEAMRAHRPVAPKPIPLRPEQVPARLFHGTTPSNLYRITREDRLDKGAHWGRVNEPRGPRLTNKMAIAKGYAKLSPHMDDQNGVVLELDGKKLAQAYKMVLYKDVDAEGNFWPGEPVDYVPLTKEIKPLSAYLVQVWIGSDTKEWVHPDNVNLWQTEEGFEDGSAVLEWIKQFLATNKYKRYRV